MWKSDELGRAVWENEGGDWLLAAGGGEAGIGVHLEGAPAVSLRAVNDDRLPAAGEQFIRGDEWHVAYPQASGVYALRMTYRPIAATANQFVLETTIAIQTDRLDTHPQLDIEVDCLDIDSFVPTDRSGDNEVESSGSAPISLAKARQHSVSVLLGPHDSPFTTNLSTDMLLRLRLFGDFLEKGVIRKARPWLVIRRGETPPGETELIELWQQLCQSPLPLTA